MQSDEVDAENGHSVIGLYEWVRSKIPVRYAAKIVNFIYVPDAPDSSIDNIYQVVFIGNRRIETGAIRIFR